ncbi:flagellar hook-length control protein FliK [Burkholderia sp. Ac-20353]|uniref:flagellar hook-length control protein FliK n=1 Tax=Burkholderia sp. Ac-20353 TaxID=2703894 RepID=UPI00197C973D|nr:flagellar hook-length control protein FliK [Burkholderia sp. Ac-20353]MBN3791714.1 flagellar hook-length control protein FliK [Burkholderia sp. Ac-20353]
MTESVATPRSRSSRPSSQSRRRTAAAAEHASARAATQPGSDEQAADAPRDEPMLDLFGDPVIETGDAKPAAARAVAAEVAAADDSATIVSAHEQATFDGFGAPQAPAVGEGAAEGGSEGERDAAATERVTTAAGSLTPPPASVSAVSGQENMVETPADAETTAATVREASARSSAGTTRRASAVVSAGEAVALPVSTEAETASEPGTQRTAVGAQSTGHAEPAIAASPRDAVVPATPATPATPAAPSAARTDAPAAAFIAKPSPSRIEPTAAAQPAGASATPSFNPEIHVRPLTDRLAALQAEADGLQRAADREMRRVNRLLLALALVMLAALVTLATQAAQMSRLKDDATARQLRIDRLTADLATQQATVVTLEQHNEVLLSQVDRLERNMARQTAAVKRARHGR